MAEKVGFEPTVPFDITGFQDRLLKPLGHLSVVLRLYTLNFRLSNLFQHFFLERNAGKERGPQRSHHVTCDGPRAVHGAL